MVLTQPQSELASRNSALQSQVLKLEAERIAMDAELRVLRESTPRMAAAVAAPRQVAVTPVRRAREEVTRQAPAQPVTNGMFQYTPPVLSGSPIDFMAQPNFVKPQDDGRGGFVFGAAVAVPAPDYDGKRDALSSMQDELWGERSLAEESMAPDNDFVSRFLGFGRV